MQGCGPHASGGGDIGSTEERKGQKRARAGREEGKEEEEEDTVGEEEEEEDLYAFLEAEETDSPPSLLPTSSPLPLPLHQPRPASAPAAPPIPHLSRRGPDKSLNFLFQALVGRKVLVELKTDAGARGVLEEADDNMNLTLTEAEHISPTGAATPHLLPFLYLPGSCIRYVHLSSRLDLDKLVERHAVTLSIQAKRFQRARLRPAPSGRQPPGASTTIQVHLPLPAAEATRPEF